MNMMNTKYQEIELVSYVSIKLINGIKDQHQSTNLLDS